MSLNRYVRQAVLYNIKNSILHKIISLCNGQFIKNNLKSILHIKKYYIYHAINQYYNDFTKSYYIVKSILEDTPDIIDYRSRRDLSLMIHDRILPYNIKLFKYLFDLIVSNSSIKILDVYYDVFCSGKNRWLLNMSETKYNSILKIFEENIIRTIHNEDINIFFYLFKYLVENTMSKSYSYPLDYSNYVLKNQILCLIEGLKMRNFDILNIIFGGKHEFRKTTKRIYERGTFKRIEYFTDLIFLPNLHYITDEFNSDNCLCINNFKLTKNVINDIFNKIMNHILKNDDLVMLKYFETHKETKNEISKIYKNIENDIQFLKDCITFNSINCFIRVISLFEYNNIVKKNLYTYLATTDKIDGICITPEIKSKEFEIILYNIIGFKKDHSIYTYKDIY